MNESYQRPKNCPLPISDLRSIPLLLYLIYNSVCPPIPTSTQSLVQKHAVLDMDPAVFAFVYAPILQTNQHKPSCLDDIHTALLNASNDARCEQNTSNVFPQQTARYTGDNSGALSLGYAVPRQRTPRRR